MDLIRTAADRMSLRAELLDTIHLLGAARANLQEALREEGEALAGACEAVNTSGAVSAQAVGALRGAQTAHARSTAAAGEVRTLNAHADRLNAAAEAPAGSLRSDSAFSGGVPRARPRPAWRAIPDA